MALSFSRVGGVYTALVTPFRNGSLDEPAFLALVDRQIAAGVHGLVAASGPDGEAATLRADEIERLIDLCVKTANGRVPVFAGASSNSTKSSVALVRRAKDLGADAALVTTPWYNRPNQDGVLGHFQTIVAAVDLPILIDNSPSRTMVDLTMATLQRLASLSNVIGIVDATGDVSRATAIRAACPRWCVLTGHDPSALGHLAHGGQGWVSTAANLAPEAVAALYASASVNDFAEARRWHDRLSDLHLALTVEPSPAAVKSALASLGLCQPDVRLPITPVSEAAKAAILLALGKAHAGYAAVPRRGRGF